MGKVKIIVIDVEVCERLKLDWLSYSIAESVYHLSNASTTGWCYANRQYFTKFLKISRTTLFRILRDLEKKKLIEIHPVTKNLRTTKIWSNTKVENNK